MIKKYPLLVAILVVGLAVPAKLAEAVSIGQICQKLGTRSTVQVKKVKVPVICRLVSKKKIWVRTAAQISTTSTTSTSTTSTSSTTSTTTIPPLDAKYGSVETLDIADPLVRYIQIPEQPKRTYRIDLPNHFDPLKRYPLVIGLHGVGGSGKIARETFALDDVTESNPVIAVYPEGSGRERDTVQSWNAGGCCSPAIDEPGYIRDVDFISIIISNMENNYWIDLSRVWVIGFSNGGMMAYRLACEIPDQITGIAVGSGAFTVETCAPSSAVNVIHLHGEQDTKVPVLGGGPYNVMSVKISIARLANANLCVNIGAIPGENPFKWLCPTSDVMELILSPNGHDWGGEWSRRMINFLQDNPRKYFVTNPLP
jgi:polyhydroxybutyrate depolymerase